MTTWLFRLGRLLLSAIFIFGGLNTFKSPEGAGKAAEQINIPRPTDAARANGGVMVVAGGAMALGIRARLAASVLALSMVPTTLAGHRFWEAADEGSKAGEQIHFLKNAGLVGGLLAVASRKKEHPAPPESEELD